MKSSVHKCKRSTDAELKIKVQGIMIRANPNRIQARGGKKEIQGKGAIEPAISHMKRNHCLGLNFLKGVVEDIHNALLAGVGYDLKLRFNQIEQEIALYPKLLLTLTRLNQSNYYSINLNPSFLNTT
ncbi:MAG: hypothetical protein H7098_03945 [Oligoflexus sp.]|nr:hypothetical protein [Pseudopedobacter sp.]